MADTPHFKFPFQLSADGRRPKETEQDSDDEILDCVQVLLMTLPSQRIDIPEYGMPEQAFLEGGADSSQIMSTIKRWEPRVNLVLSVDEVIDLGQHVRLNYTARDNG